MRSIFSANFSTAWSAKPVAAMLLALAISPAFAQGDLAPAPAPVPMLKTQAPGYYRMMLGKFEITAISDGTVTIPLDKLLTNIPQPELRERLAQNHLSTQVETSINAFVINTGTRLILVDTGSGPLFGKDGGRLLDNLRAAGYPPEKIDTVLLTHIHADHSGGLVHNGRPALPNATVYVNRRDADFWLNPANITQVRDSEKHTFAESESSLRPVINAGRLKTFSGETELFPGVRALPDPGHTPGHTLYMIDSDGQKLLLWGDTIHAEAAQFARPATTITFDWNSEQAAAARSRVLADAARNGYWIGAAHISFPGLGHVAVLPAAGKGKPAYRWIPANYSLAGLSLAGLNLGN
ncbi:MBL fold metallo-hydrolase [Sodalis sp. RH21]|uniref:MBL fold metallo-hydrolase n=1 Tax=unclassified Sodalis (in: enterobacteria) TaxID=2636512 RepID=UPI0039B382CE